MFELIDYKPEHAMEIAANAVEPNLKFMDTGKNDAWAIELGKHPANTMVYNGRVVACGGIVILVPEHRAEAWIMLVEDIGTLHIDPKIARDRLYDWIVENKIIRLEAPLRADFEAGIKYAKYLGFKYEATLKQYHPDGTDAAMHTIVRGGK